MIKFASRWEGALAVADRLGPFLNEKQNSSLSHLVTDLSSMDIAYHLYAKAWTRKSRSRIDAIKALHHAKCYVCAIRRFQLLFPVVRGAGWPKPVSQIFRNFEVSGERLLALYKGARQAIEHVDEHGRTAQVWVWMQCTGDLYFKPGHASEIKVNILAGEALAVSWKLYEDLVNRLVEHFAIDLLEPLPTKPPVAWPTCATSSNASDGGA